MKIRLAIIQTSRSQVLETFEPVLRDMAAQVALTVVAAAPGAPLRTLRRLLAAQPHIVVAEAGPPPPRAAKLYRLLAPQSRLVLSTSDTTPYRFKRRRVDAVVRDPDDLRRTVDRLRAQFARPSPLVADLDLFRFSAMVRVAATAHRVLYVGDLSPRSSAPDVLIALAAWAEANPHRTAEIWWSADGDLSGVLAAQPLPPNLTQQFHGAVARQLLPELMARCGILVAATDSATETAPILEAWAAGLVVVASRRVLAARFLLRGDSPGWLFDPARPGGLAEALGQVLACDPARLDGLREHGQRLAGELAAQTVKRPAIAEFLRRSPMVSSKTVAS